MSWNSKADQPIPLPGAEQMIDDLDRIMTTYGTISVKTPDVWGQDRLAKFRSEYEAEMAEWLKHGFKGDINASVRRSEIEATQVQVGTDLGRASAKNGDGADADDDAISPRLSKAHAAWMRPFRHGNCPGQGTGGARAHGGARRALQLPQSPQPVAAHQCRRRPGRQAGLWPLLVPDPGDALARPEEPQG